MWRVSDPLAMPCMQQANDGRRYAIRTKNEQRRMDLGCYKNIWYLSSGAGHHFDS